ERNQSAAQDGYNESGSKQGLRKPSGDGVKTALAEINCKKEPLRRIRSKKLHSSPVVQSVPDIPELLNPLLFHSLARVAKAIWRRLCAFRQDCPCQNKPQERTPSENAVEEIAFVAGHCPCQNKPQERTPSENAVEEIASPPTSSTTTMFIEKNPTTFFNYTQSNYRIWTIRRKLAVKLPNVHNR
ncbi:1693_t:CDS:2, partial [Paraglomus occultum]